jgi:predicted transcriptional regulator
MTFQISDPKRRDKLIIILDILSIAYKGASKTKIMHRGNLSFTQTNEYVEFLLEHKLLEEVPTGAKVVYKPTAKGTLFIEKQRDILNIIDENEGKQCLLIAYR